MIYARLMQRAIICLAAVLLAVPATAQGPRRAIGNRSSVRTGVLAHFAQFEEELEPEPGLTPLDVPQRDEEAFDDEALPEPPEERRLVPEEYRTPADEDEEFDETDFDDDSRMREADQPQLEFDDPILPWGEGPYDAAAIMGDACGNCGFRACVCPPCWYGSAEFSYLQRQRPRNIVLSRDLAGLSIVPAGGTFIIILPEVLEIDSDAFDYEPGMRVKIGRQLGSDFIHRDHMVEFEYFGLQEWEAAASVAGAQQISYPIGAPQFDVPGVVSPDFLNSGSLMSPFPNAVGGFNHADFHQFDYASNLHSFEINYRVRRGPERDRLVYRSDGVWEPQPGPSWRISMLGGFRALKLDEDFSFRSRGRSTEGLETGPGLPDIVFPATRFDFSGDLEIQTHNRLFGFQTGGDVRIEAARFSFAVRGKAGAYANFAVQTSSLLVTDRTLFLLPNRADEFDDVSLAFIGEVGFEARYRLTPAVALRAAYDFMWVTGLALAPEQIEFTTIQEPKVNSNGAVLIQGLTAGFEMTW